MPDEIHIISFLTAMIILRPLVVVAIHTGMRKGELLNLEWDQVNLEQGIISLVDTKNGERRDIPINKTVKATLAEYLKIVDLMFLVEEKEERLSPCV